MCFTPSPAQIRVRFEPAFLVLAPGQKRSARVVVDPDFCAPHPVRFEGSDNSVVATPKDSHVDLGSPTVELELEGEAAGASTITVSVPTGGDDGDVTATLSIEVMADETPSCSSSDDTSATMLEAGESISAKGSLAGARISLPAGADKPNSGSFLWSVPAFETSIGCSAELTPPGYLAMGPAVRFGPSERTFLRDMPLTIPINPARLPAKARWRHVRVAYSGPKFKKPRTIPVTNPRPMKVDGQWVLSFMAPRLGNYQAVVKTDAGTVTRMRPLTHRAVIGVSMGGAGAAQFGLRHHHLFDVVAALGGPVDWTWLMDHLEGNHMAGFRSIAPGTKLEDIQLERTSCTTDQECQADETCIGVINDPPTSGKCTLMPEPDEPYEHPSVFNAWWYEYPRQGNGGSFDRREYVQIFRDLALMFGNPNSYNPLALQLPAGIDPNDPTVIGDHKNGECKIWIDPIDDHPNEDKQKELANKCPGERCKYTTTLHNYYDDEFNPDGTFPVITFCDGAPQDKTLSPYANTWIPSGNNYPMEVALAVDYNGNGERDELEPVIRSGRENYSDWGTDQTPSEFETGYSATNLDPAGDDYEPQYNPSGDEGDHRYQLGEPFEDYGLDGVDGTAASPYDFGEGDGTFTMSPGMQRFYEYDGRSVVRQWKSLATTPLDDDALARIDFWTDGGTRDLFNCTVMAQHITGGFVARDRAAAYFNDFNFMPGLDPSTPDQFNPSHLVYEDLQGVINIRYGKDDPNAQDVETGSGQHVGTATEITRRMQAALYFMGSRWPDGHRKLVEVSPDKPAEGVPACEVTGNCTFSFTSSFGRTGPVAVSLPPGYGHADQQELRYPVIYMLHGYGMTPEDLQAAIVFLRNWMNGTTDSQYSRLPKAILVYVDGRCRTQPDGQGNDVAECIRGTFFADSIREDGPQMDAWWLELMDEVDKRFRTLGPSTIEWTQ